MKGSMLVINPKGEQRLVEIIGEPSLDIIKTGIGGGHIEIIPFFQDLLYKGKIVSNCVAFCDEEGKLKNLPYNEHATTQWQGSLKRQGRTLYDSEQLAVDFLVGDIAVIWGDKAFMEAL